MRRIVGSVFQSLDGVIQGPGGPTEDPTGGFAYSGWMPPVTDAAVGDEMERIFTGEYDLLLGRRTYEIFAAYWPYHEAGGDHAPIATQFNRAAKYVLTGNPDQPLEWENSHRLGNIDAVAALKRQDGPTLVVQGSSTLYPALIAAGLLDRLTTLTFPLVLGRGRRMFGGATLACRLALVRHAVTPGGTIIAEYEPGGPVETGSFGDPVQNARETARQKRMRGGW
jgi:dihydrofolate reductase